MRNSLKKITALFMAALMLLAVLAVGALGDEQYSNSVTPGIGLYSIFDPETPVVTYIFYNGETEYARQAVKDGETLYEPEAPVMEQDNTVFTGWYREDGTKFAEFGVQTVTAKDTIKLYAHFAPAYYVYFYTPDGETLKFTEIVTDHDVHDFSGKVTAGELSYNVGTTTKVTGWAAEMYGKTDVSNAVSVPEGQSSISLYAIETPGYWVVFHTGDGTSVAPKFIEAGNELDLSSISEPSCTGYSFAGWVDANGIIVTKVTGEAELYAKWNPEEANLTVVFWYENADDDGYSYVGSKELYVDTGKSVSSGDYRNETFDGRDATHFTYNANKVETVTVSGDGTTKLNVYFTRNTYTFTFQVRSGRNWTTIHSFSAKYLSNISDKWSFTGTDGKTYPQTNPPTSWTPQNSSTYTARITRMERMPGENITFRHTTSDNTIRHFYYYVEALNGTQGTRNFDGKSFDLYLDLTHDFNQIYYNDDFFILEGFTRYKIATKDDEVLKKAAGDQWSWNDGGYWDTGWDSKLYFYYTRNSYTLEFYNYNTKLEDRKASVQYEAPLQGYVNFIPPYPSGVEEGILTFDGWYTNQLFEKKVDIDATMPANNIMLYAHWIPKEYTVSFDLGYEGAIDTPATQYVQAKGQATQPDDPVREGFKFLGWYDGDEPFSFDKQILKDTVLTAKWLSESTFQVAYDANGGSGQVPTDDTKYADGAKAAIANKGELMPPAPTEDNPEEKVFLGWATRADATNADYQPGDAMEIKADNAVAGVITLYAVWGPKPNTTRLTYNANYIAEGASSADTVQHTENGSSELVNNATVALYPDSTFNRPGYQLIGWSKTPGEENEKDYDCGESVIVDNLGEDENILYAVWKRTTVDVTITKQVTGNMGDRSKSFNFTVVSSEAMGSGEGYTLSGDAKNATFTLSHDHSMTLKDVPIGATLTVTEEATGYESSMTFNGTAASNPITVQEGSNEIVVTNNLDATPDTGVLLDSLPYILILAVVVAIGVIVFIRKRRNRDDD